MRQIEDMSYVPGEEGVRVKVTYGAVDGITEFTGKVTEIHRDKKKVKNGSIWKYDILSDEGTELFLESTSSLSVNLYRILSDGRHRMNSEYGNVKVEKI